MCSFPQILTISKKGDKSGKFTNDELLEFELFCLFCKYLARDEKDNLSKFAAYKLVQKIKPKHYNFLYTICQNKDNRKRMDPGKIYNFDTWLNTAPNPNMYTESDSFNDSSDDNNSPKKVKGKTNRNKRASNIPSDDELKHYGFLYDSNKDEFISMIRKEQRWERKHGIYSKYNSSLEDSQESNNPKDDDNVSESSNTISKNTKKKLKKHINKIYNKINKMFRRNETKNDLVTVENKDILLNEGYNLCKNDIKYQKNKAYSDIIDKLSDEIEEFDRYLLSIEDDINKIENFRINIHVGMNISENLFIYQSQKNINYKTLEDNYQFKRIIQQLDCHNIYFLNCVLYLIEQFGIDSFISQWRTGNNKYDIFDNISELLPNLQAPQTFIHNEIS